MAVIVSINISEKKGTVDLLPQRGLRVMPMETAVTVS